jgi:hypothetical protein
MRIIRCSDGFVALLTGPSTKESCGGLLNVVDGKVVGVRLLPLDLGFGRPLSERGWPRYADRRLGESIIKQVQSASRQLGTIIRYSSEENAGYVDLSADR